jgi:hypothetical protein
VGRISFEENLIAHVELGRRIAPGDPAVTSRDHAGNPRQSCAHTASFPSIGPAPNEAGPVPDIGEPQAKMHVIGDHAAVVGRP